MARLHVLPVGTSILDNLERDWNRSKARDLRDNAAEYLTRPESLHEKTVAIPWTDLTTKVSAERASLDVARFSTGANDDALLLCSDTDDGVLAALLLAASLGVDPATLRCQPSAEWRRERPLTIVRVGGLSPEDPLRFGTALAEIAKVFRVVRDIADDQSIVVHLTGGFKATVPHLVFLGQCLAALAPRGRVSASILWEGANESIPVPLFAIDIDSLRDELRIDGRVPYAGTRRYEGVLYTLREGRRTDLGEAVWTLVRPEGA